MTQEEIKSETQGQYDIMQNAKLKIEELRAICKHPNTEECPYSFRVGNIEPAIICSDCGKLIWLYQNQ